MPVWRRAGFNAQPDALVERCWLTTAAPSDLVVTVNHLDPACSSLSSSVYACVIPL